MMSRRESEAIQKLKFIRSGKPVSVELVALEQAGDAGAFVAAAKQLRESTELPAVLMSSDRAALAGALEVLADRRPLVYAADKSNFAAMAQLAAKFKAPLAVKGETLEELADLTTKIKAAGVADLVLAPAIRKHGGRAGLPDPVAASGSGKELPAPRLSGDRS